MADFLKLTLLQFVLGCMLAAQDQPILQTYSIENGLSNNWVRAAVQDHSGFIWFATLEGLTRFDGYTFKSYPYQNKDNDIDTDRVHSLAIDNDGYLWVSRYFWSLERFNPNNEESTSFPVAKNISGDNMITDIFFDPPNYVWLGHEVGDLSRLNKSDSSLVHFQIEHDTLSNTIVNDIHRDQTGNLWIATNNGLYLFDSINTTFNRYLYQDHEIGHNNQYYENINDLSPGKLILETRQGPVTFDILSKRFKAILGFEYRATQSIGNFSVRKGNYNWIGYQPESNSDELTGNQTGGLIKYNVETESISIYPLDAQIPLLLDQSGNIWVHSKSKGVSSFNPDQRKFRGYQWNKDTKATGSPTAAMMDSQGFLWVGTDHGLYKLQFDHENRLKLIKDFKSTVAAKVTSLFQSQDKMIWITTPKGVYQCHPESHAVSKFRMESKPREELPADFENGINGIHQDASGSLWFTGKGLLEVNQKTESARYYGYQKVLQGAQEDSYQNIWFPDTTGNLLVFNKQKEQFHKFKVPYSKLVWELFMDSSGTMWVGGATGLYSFETKPFDILLSQELRIKNHTHLLRNDYVAQIQGHHNSLWVRCVKGLVKINILTNKAEYYDKYDGIEETVWSSWSTSFNDSIGRLYFFWGNGINIFHPDSINYNDYIPSILFTDLKVFNKSLGIGDSIKGKQILSQAIHNTSTIQLPPGLTFSLDFTALDYTNPNENLYSYMLEGLDQEWSTPGRLHTVTYTNLWEGDYTLRVKGSNNDGVWNEEGSSIQITVLPPWYRSKTAYGIYGSVLLLGLLLARKFIVQQEREKAQTRLQLVELEKTKELDRAKTNFFANVSHEFRTPLTLILGPLMQIYEGNFKGDLHKTTGVMIRNSQRLLQLVNQLLDFSKLEAGATSLEASVGDLVEFMRSMFAGFETAAQSRNIRYVFQSESSSLPAYFDREKMEKVIVNLLSNAFKFTEEGGTIFVKLSRNVSDSTVDQGDGIVEIRVEDSGQGIPAHKLPHIFDRFYQADPSFTRLRGGTGIGLALVKELVELHSGTITVTSKKGSGSAFVVHLPLGKFHLAEDQIVIHKGHLPFDSIIVETIPPVQQDGTDHPGNGSLPRVLVIDDNEDMRLYLREILSEKFQIMELSDGLQGWEYAIEHTPDLIVSDVMMPELDGQQLCQKLKTDERTSHIPVVLLTARAGSEAKIEGLESGADDYITKPFSQVELRARVQNLIELRQKLREQFSKIVTLEPSEIVVKSVDDRFLKRALEIVEIHRTDTAFDSESYARELSMSRSQLHRKLKALTNQSTGEFIRSYRLNYARKLILQDFGEIAQICYECGFSSPSYFTECFKKQFGVLPSKLTKSNLKH